MAQLQTVENGGEGFHRFGDIVLTDADIDVAVGRIISLQESHIKQGTVNQWDCKRAVSAELDLMLAKKRAEVKGASIRAEFEKDLPTRLARSPRPEAVEGSEDPGEQLDRLTRRIMAEKGVDYNAGLLEAQRQRKDLGEAILKQLNEYRAR
jgi:hypothetical protein